MTNAERVCLMLVGIEEMEPILGIGKHMVYKLIREDPNFPQPWVFPVSRRRVWVRKEIVAYAKTRNRVSGQALRDDDRRYKDTAGGRWAVKEPRKGDAA